MGKLQAASPLEPHQTLAKPWKAGSVRHRERWRSRAALPGRSGAGGGMSLTTLLHEIVSLLCVTFVHH